MSMPHLSLPQSPPPQAHQPLLQQQQQLPSQLQQQPIQQPQQQPPQPGVSNEYRPGWGPPPLPSMSTIVTAALAPLRDRNAPYQDSSMVVQASIPFAHDDGAALSVAELTRTLLERDCPEDWLLRVCARSPFRSPATLERHRRRRVVCLYYGDGYETTVLLQGQGNQKVGDDDDDDDGDEWHEPDVYKIGVGLCMATPADNAVEIQDLPTLLPMNSIWEHITYGMHHARCQPRLYVRTGGLLWCDTGRQDGGRKRTIRVWATPRDPHVVGRLEVVPSGLSSTSLAMLHPPSHPARATAPSILTPHMKHPPTSSILDDAKLPAKPPAKKRGPAKKSTVVKPKATKAQAAAPQEPAPVAQPMAPLVAHAVAETTANNASFLHPPPQPAPPVMAPTTLTSPEKLPPINPILDGATLPTKAPAKKRGPKKTTVAKPRTTKPKTLALPEAAPVAAQPTTPRMPNALAHSSVDEPPAAMPSLSPSKKQQVKTNGVTAPSASQQEQVLITHDLLTPGKKAPPPREQVPASHQETVLPPKVTKPKTPRAAKSTTKKVATKKNGGRQLTANEISELASAFVAEPMAIQEPPAAVITQNESPIPTIEYKDHVTAAPMHEPVMVEDDHEQPPIVATTPPTPKRSKRQSKTVEDEPRPKRKKREPKTPDVKRTRKAPVGKGVNK